jgi:flagellin
MISIQTNVNSLIAQQNLSVTSAFQSKTIAQLTSGYRINQSGDDAAGLAVANKFRSTVAELTQGVANGNDATAQLQIMDGGMSNISMILDRLKTLATQSASGTFTGDRSTVNQEFQNDLLEIDRQAQSIGLDSGGAFAKNLNVYLGEGSGSSSLANGVVTLGLTQSAVDSSALGMKGMQQVNVTYAADGSTNTGTSIGATSATSVQAIVGNTSGANPNQEATAGYAALQFSGAGFSDAGKALVSVNLAGVTDTNTLVAAVNSAIQTAGNGSTAAATAFKNANIVASVHTDSNGGQELAFSSSTAAFQVQAGDQMANALMGNVTVVGTAAQGAAISGTSATNVAGAATTAGSLTPGQTVKLVVTGGGLASPVTLQVNTAGGSPVSTTGAIIDLEAQFAANAQLTAAGLTMAGSSTPGTALSFASAVGQSFNIQVTGDTSNLLGLGSFSADAAGNADYTAVTAGTAYSATAVTGNATTTGLTDGLQVSLNGLAATALTAIDLTTGAHAVAASLTSSATITGGFTSTAGQVDLTATTDQANITVINNGVVNNQAFTFGANTAESQATAVSTTTPGMTQAGFLGYTETAAGNDTGRHDQFTIALDGGTAHTVTLDNTYASGSAGAAAFLSGLQTAIDGSGIGSGKVVASWAGGTGELTLTSNVLTNATGAASSLSIGAATNATAGKAVSSITSATGGTFAVSAFAHTNQFSVAWDGGSAMTLTLADNPAYTATTFLTAVQNAIANTGGSTNSLGSDQTSHVSANWALDSSGLHTGALTLTSATTGAGSTVTIGAVTNATKGSATSTTLSDSFFPAGTITTSANNDKFQVSIDGGPNFTATMADTGYTGGGAKVAFLAAVQSALNSSGIGSGNVTASWGALGGTGSGALTFTDTSGVTGAGSTVAVSTFTYSTKAVTAESTVTNPSGTTLSPATITTSGTHDAFNVALDGGPTYAVTVADAAYSDSTVFLAAIQTSLDASGVGVGNITASYDATHHLILSDTSGGASGLSSSLNLSAVAGNDGLTAIFGFTAATARGTIGNVDGGLGKVGLSTSPTIAAGNSALANTGYTPAGLTLGINTAGNPTAANTGLGVLGIGAGLTTGANDAPQTVQSIAATIQTRFGGAALVTVSNDNKISIASTTKGANSSVLLNATANSVYSTLNLTSPVGVAGLNSSLADVVNNLNAQFAANTTYQNAGLTAVATKADGTVDGVTPGNNTFINIQSNNGTQFRLNAVGAAAGATAAAVSSTVTVSSLSVASPITVTLNTNDKINVSVNGLTAQPLQIAAGTYNTSGALLTEVQAEIAASVDPTNGLAGRVTAGWDAATQKLTLTSVAAGTTASVVTSAVGGNTGLGNLGFAATTSTGQLFSATENTGFGVAGRTNLAAAPSSTGTAMSASDAYGTSNSTAFTFSAMKYGSDKQALTFSATDSNGVLETQTIALQNNLATNRAGVSIDSAVAYINQQLQKSTSNPALQKIVAVKEVVGGAEEINFVSSLSNFTVGVAATANGDGLNLGVATQKISATNGAGANMDVSTQAGAMAAVTAIATAIAKLGTAQAAVGKGENELGYAVNLAQSQITNFSAAESQIRDANVAQQAANLSKAQVLSQASIAAMAQANSAPQAVLSLLRG